MPFMPKLQITLSAVFILTTAGALESFAQTQDVSDRSTTSAAASGASIIQPKKTEVTKPALAFPDDTSSANTSRVKWSLGESTAKTKTTASASTATNTTMASASSAPQGTQPTDNWEFQLTPYFWLGSLHGTTGTANRTTQLDESFSDIFHSLKFVLMGTFEARKDKLILVTDLEYLSIGDDRATPGPFFSAVDSKVKTFIFNPEVGYRVFDNPEKGASVDLLGGIRVWHISTDLTFSPGILPGTRVQASRNWVDAVGGLRAKAAISKKMFVTGHFDLGGGGSKFTYQIFGGAGYNVTPKVALIFGYRVLDVNYDKNNFVYDMSQRGPILGIGFKF